MTDAAAKRLASVPYWAQPLPLPPEHDFLADVKEDRKLAAVMCAVARIAKQRGESFAEQVEIWTKEVEDPLIAISPNFSALTSLRRPPD